MKVTFLAPTPLDLSAFGVRALTAFLKQNGIEVQTIFLPGGVERYRYGKDFRYEYSQNILDEIIDLCKEADLIGISLMSNYFERAVQLSAAVKSALKTPVIWGGIHPTVMPEDSLKYCDMVCLSEGEYALLELVRKMENGQDISNVNNIWLKKDNRIIPNPLRPLEQNLDVFPFYDFSLDNHFVYDFTQNHISPMTHELLKMSFLLEPHTEGTFDISYKRTRSYKTMTTRGCPHRCAFCAERTLSLLHKGEKYLRKKSVNHVINELLWVKKELPFVESIFLFDDTFLSRTTAEINDFASEYKQKIGLPFHIQASPLTLSQEKMEKLMDAGLVFVEMGIQTASEKGKELYNRHVSNEKVLSAARILSKYQGKIYPPCYHVILDNPWETTEDVMETLDLVLKIPAPFWLKRASLVCFPGTELFTKARKDGILKTEDDIIDQIYRKHLHQPKGSYVNFLMYLAGFSKFPRKIIQFLAKPAFFKQFDTPALERFFLNLNKIGDMMILIAKGITALSVGDFSRISRYFKKNFSKIS